MDFLKGALKTVDEFSKVVDALQQNNTPCSVCSLSRVHKANVIDTLPECFSERALVVVSDEGEAQKVYEDLLTLGANAKIWVTHHHFLYGARQQIVINCLFHPYRKSKGAEKIFISPIK